MTERRRNPQREDEGEPGFLSRWSRRKAQVRSGRDPDIAEIEDVPPAPQADDGPAPTPESAARDEPHHDWTDEDLPPVESLDENSDYSRFMSPKVSEHVRRQALRKLFRSSKYNIPCEMADDAGDFRSFQPLGEIVPQDMKRALMREAERLKQTVMGERGEAGGTAAPDRKPDEVAGAEDRSAPDAASAGDDASSPDTGEPDGGKGSSGQA